MVIYTLALLAGICSFQFFPQLPSLAWACLPGFVALGCWFKTSLRPLSVFLLALLWAWWHAYMTLSSQLPDTYSGKDVLLQGYIEGIPKAVGRNSYRFVFMVERLRPENAATWVTGSYKTRLRWYRNALDLRAGENWQLRVRLKPPHGLANPGGFDYERWLFSKRFGATGYVRNSGDNSRLILNKASCAHISCWRQQLSQTLAANSKPEVSGLIRALVVGDKSGINHQQWDILRATGTAHLMAISGLHIGLVSGLLFAVTRKLWKIFGIVQYYPATKGAALAAILGALVYSMLGGFALPTQRALVMVTVFMSAYLLNRSAQPWRALCISLSIILLADPFSVLTPGFWLSFGAVAWIFYVLNGRYGQIGKFTSAVRIQIALSFGLLPFLLIGFQQASFTAPVANLIVVPVVGIIVVPALLLGSLMLMVWPSIGGFIIQISGFILQFVSRFLTGLDSIPGDVLQQGINGLIILFVITAALFMLAPAGLAVRFSGLLLLGPLVFSPMPRPKSGVVWLDLLDVGQGLAAVVRTEHHALVYDTGPKSRSGFDTGKTVVVPFLVHEGMHQIDTLVISHSDNDHQGGAESLFGMIEVDSILSGMPQSINFARARRCVRGQHWDWDGVQFEVLSPLNQISGNNSSCVLRITAKNGQRLLLTGDIEAEIEQQLVNDFGKTLQAEIIVAPHHGSRTSSTAPFIGLVDPNIVLFPAGFRNRFGFPKSDIAERYRRLGTESRVTGRDGAIRVALGRPGEPPLITTFRQDRRRYWRKLSAD